MKRTDLHLLGAATALSAVFGGAGAALSLAAAVAAVRAPQTLMLFFARRCPPQNAFSLWAGKFSATILLLAAAGRLLHSGGWFAAEFFVFGAAAGLAWNIVSLARQTETA